MIAYAPPPAIVQPAPARPTPASIQAAFYEQLATGLVQERLTLREYLPEAWRVIEPARAFRWNWSLEAIVEHLEAVQAGQITRLIINGPPRSGKSIPVSVVFPTWVWSLTPQTRFIASSYAGDLATKHNTDRRDIIQSEWYQGKWGRRFQLAGDQNLKREFENNARGHMVARGTGGGITGYGADIIVADDPMNPMLAESDTERQSVIDYYDGTLYTRLDDKARGAIIINEQRLHARDLTAHVLKNGEPWVQLVLPAVEPRGRVVTFPMTKRTVERKQGDVLWPERESAETLAKVRVAMGSRRFGAQYLQAPSEEEGQILKRTWWKYYGKRPDVFDLVLQSWDMAFKGTDGSDYVVGGVLGRLGPHIYLLDLVRDRMTFTETVKAFENLTAKWPKAHRKLVEEKANGAAAIDVLSKRIGGIVPINPEGGKVVRARAIEPYLEAGNIWLPRPQDAPWVEPFVEECAAFPEGANDDQVDMLTQAVIWIVQGQAKQSWEPIA